MNIECRFTVPPPGTREGYLGSYLRIPTRKYPHALTNRRRRNIINATDPPCVIRTSGLREFNRDRLSRSQLPARHLDLTKKNQPKGDLRMKRLLIGGVLVLSSVLALELMGFAQNNGVTTDPEITAILSNVDSARILNTATTLQKFRTRQSCSDQPEQGQGVTAARDFIFKQYSSIPGLQVRLDPFVHGNCPNSPTFNVIAWLPGKNANQLVIIGGHYDSRTTNVLDSVSDAPGGNDSGAQTAVVLELARIFACHPFDSTIVFMSFSAEEQGLFGSASIAANLNRYFKNPEVIAMLNTDIPGGDIAANRPADLGFFRLYSSGIPRERFSTDPDGTTDNTSPARGGMRNVGTWGGPSSPSLTLPPQLPEDPPRRPR